MSSHIGLASCPLEAPPQTGSTWSPHFVEPVKLSSLRPYPGNARTHSKKQLRQIAKSIERFGFTNPILISDENEIIAGHGRVKAAKLLGRSKVPALRLSHLSAAERRAYVLADNKLAQNAGWDREILAIELQALVDIDFDVDLTGFGPAEIDVILDEARDSSPDSTFGPEDDEFPMQQNRQRNLANRDVNYEYQGTSAQRAGNSETATRPLALPLLCATKLSITTWRGRRPLSSLS